VAGTPDPLVPLAGRNIDGRPSDPTDGVAPLFGPEVDPLRGGAAPVRPESAAGWAPEG
jgi:hypothetical protein